MKVFSLISRLFRRLLHCLVLCWRVSKLPGPPAAFLTGHSAVAKDKGMLETLVRWERVYKDFHKFFMGPFPLVFVYSPDLVKAILSKKQDHNDKGFLYHSWKPLLGDGLISSNGEKWFNQRRLITSTFHFSILENYFPIIVTQTEVFLAELCKSPLITHFHNICPFTRKLTLNIICETSMGVFLDTEKDEEQEIILSMDKLEGIGTKRMMKPWLLIDEIYELTKLSVEEKKHKQNLHKFTNKLIKRRRSQIKERLIHKDIDNNGKKKKEIFIDQLILQQLNGRNLTDDDIRDEVNTFIFAGHNTTQLAINYCAYLLGLHKDCQEKAIREQDEIFGGSDREPTLADLNRMAYLDRFIKEALRLYPSVPFIARRLTKDIHLGKHTIPQGVDCILLPYVTHRSPEMFPNPQQFDPDNFLPERVNQRHPYSYFPFSAGPRNCIGKRFASLVEKTVISGILRKFTIDSLQKPEDLTLIVIAILIPKGGLKVKLTPRESKEKML